MFILNNNLNVNVKRNFKRHKKRKISMKFKIYELKIGKKTKVKDLKIKAYQIIGKKMLDSKSREEYGSYWWQKKVSGR